MRRALDRIGADVTAGEVDALVKRMDVDDDGKVSYPEFVRWFNTAQDNAALMGQHDSGRGVAGAVCSTAYAFN